MENKNTDQQQNQPKPQSRPDDVSAVSVSGSLKIFDPKTKKIFVEQKA
jgi:hypothetical protein